MAELGPDHTLGGQRDLNNFWDFFDVSGDQRIDLTDALLVLASFGASPVDPAYNQNLDRYSPDPSHAWRSATAIDGTGIDLTDALTNLASFGDGCSGTP